jgi:2,4-dienoyl-CoA reductase-like NADH-dependent reductase (Old Yellow Enzyme family)
VKQPSPHENGNGYLGAPGMYDDSQIAGWKMVTDAVHAKGGKDLPAALPRGPPVQ